jgi:hypothetical protein
MQRRRYGDRPRLAGGQPVAAAAGKPALLSDLPRLAGLARLGRPWSWLDGHLQLLAQPGKLPAAGCGWICAPTQVLFPLELPQQRLQQRPVLVTVQFGSKAVSALAAMRRPLRISAAVA